VASGYYNTRMASWRVVRAHMRADDTVQLIGGCQGCGFRWEPMRPLVLHSDGTLDEMEKLEVEVMYVCAYVH
jgi:hypothetical protein